MRKGEGWNKFLATKHHTLDVFTFMNTAVENVSSSRMKSHKLDPLSICARQMTISMFTFSNYMSGFLMAATVQFLGVVDTHEIIVLEKCFTTSCRTPSTPPFHSTACVKNYVNLNYVAAVMNNLHTYFQFCGK